ncbi:MAG: hypothetical protein D4S01_07400 [Dehalococcoidia bacterium]|nr:MAG: hypothetical protein D4S01_07400 [Dehalococcoidia bacterium]
MSKDYGEYYVKWAFKTIEDLMVVLNHFVDCEVGISSFGSGDVKYGGHYSHEGRLTLTHPHAAAAATQWRPARKAAMALLEWSEKAVEETPNYWMSPYGIYIAGIRTCDPGTGKDIGGEAYDWGLR